MAKLTKEDLVNIYKITEITPEGRIFKGSLELCGNVDRPHTRQGRTYVRKRLHLAKPDGTFTHILFSRAVYAWFHGEAKDGMVIDHIDGNPLNNEISNLREITNEDNVRVYHKEQKNNPVDRYEYVKSKIKALEEKLEKDVNDYETYHNFKYLEFIFEDERQLRTLDTALAILEDIKREQEIK